MLGSRYAYPHTYLLIGRYNLTLQLCSVITNQFNLSPEFCTYTFMQGISHHYEDPKTPMSNFEINKWHVAISLQIIFYPVLTLRLDIHKKLENQETYQLQTYLCLTE